LADYIAIARSNYFYVKDRAAFNEFCQDNNLEVIEDSETGQVGFLRDGSVPRAANVAGPDGLFREQGFYGALATHLKKGSVAIVMEVGSEKFRYLNGYAVAVNSKGKTVEINLDEIYGRAKRLTSCEITSCEY
jgi:hypothetical protein